VLEGTIGEPMAQSGSTSSQPPRSPGRAKILEAVREAALAITSELSLDDLLHRLAGLGRDLVHAKYAAIGVASPDGRGLERFIVSGLSDQEVAAIGDWPRGYGLLGAILAEQKPIRLDNIASDPRSVGFPTNHPPMTSFLGVPIIARGRVLGSFYLADKLGARSFAPEDEHLIVLFAAHAALSIENARLFTQTDTELRDKVAQLRRAEERSRFLAEFAALLPGRPTTEISLHRVAAKIADVLGDVCSIRLFTKTEPHQIRLSNTFHRNQARIVAADAVLDRLWPAVITQVVETGQPIFVPDASLTLPSPEASALREGHCTGVVILPMATQSALYGVLAAFSSGAYRFSGEDLAFATILAERLATALENVELHEKLGAAMKAREEFVSIAAHELKTPVAVLRGSADILNASPELDPERRQRVVDTITRNAEHLATLTNQLLDEFRLQSGRLDFSYTELDLVALVREVIDRIRNHSRTVTIEVRAECERASGLWDRGRLDQVITNLVDNAVKYSEPGAPIMIRIWQEASEYRLSVADHGIGIPEDSQPHIREAFFRAPNARAANPNGTGLGLHLSSEILERLGGHLWFESREKQGTIFYVAVPVRAPEAQSQQATRT